MILRHCVSAVAFLGAVGVAGAFIACGAESGTTGKRVVLHTRVAAGPTSFTNALGWSVKLTTARVSVGPLYYFDGDPIFSLRRLLLPRVAHAHPGHYVPGNAKGEMTASAVVDLLSGPAPLPDGTGVTGPYRSARFTFGAAPAAHVEGEASNGTTTIKFAGSVALADVHDSYGEPKLDGCVFTPVDVASDGTVTVTVLPTVWFDQVDFTDVKSELAGTAAFNGLTRGMKKGTAYTFAYAPQ